LKIAVILYQSKRRTVILNAEEIIKKFNLKPQPTEGGYYVETYRAEHVLLKSCLPDSYESQRALSTAIYYMLTPGTKSVLHRLPTDEVYHFYLGDPVLMLQLYPDGTTKILILGHDIKAGQSLQITVPKNVWQGLLLMEGGNYALMGTTMAPGFDFPDNEIGNRDYLLKEYSSEESMIVKLTD
jgi:hypothetical protein